MHLDERTLGKPSKQRAPADHRTLVVEEPSRVQNELIISMNRWVRSGDLQMTVRGSRLNRDHTGTLFCLERPKLPRERPVLPGRERSAASISLRIPGPRT